MDNASIVKLFKDWTATVDLNNKYNREKQALDFYMQHKDIRGKSGQKITQKRIGLAFNITAKRMGDIIKNPLSIGKAAGAQQRMQPNEELKLVNWIEQRCHAHIYTSKDNVIDQANKIMNLRSAFGYGMTTMQRLVLRIFKSTFKPIRGKEASRIRTKPY